MLFWRADANRRLRWLFIAIGLGLFVSTSAVVSAKGIVKDAQPVDATAPIDKVFVDKSERVLQLLSGDKVIKTYHIALGGSPVGHKQRQGDNRTPTGSYVLDYKNEKSKFYRSIHVSYPNATDKAQAKKLGVNPGGDIMIHGQRNGFGHLADINQQRDWTEGCIAVTDNEMDEIMAAVELGMPIEIVE